MDKHETQYEIKEMFSTCISEWLFKGDVTVCKYVTGHVLVICSQTQIGWDYLFRGNMSVEWMDLQEQYMRNQGIDKAGYVWGATIVECLGTTYSTADICEK